jgi:hypothetical protein
MLLLDGLRLDDLPVAFQPTTPAGWMLPVGIVTTGNIEDFVAPWPPTRL